MLTNVIKVSLVNLLLLFSACGESVFESPAEYVQAVGASKSPLRQEKTLANFRYEVLYKPLDYVVLQEYPEAERERRKKEYAGMQYYTFRIVCPKWKDDLLKYGTEDYTEYTQRLAYCMSAMQEQLLLEESGQVRPCRLFHYERLHQLDAGLTFLIAFDKNPAEREAELADRAFEYTDKTLIFDDRLFGNGQIRLTIPGKNLNKQPRFLAQTR